MSGIVSLVGAGPGDPGLITVRGRELLISAEVVVYDRLIGGDLLELAPSEAEFVFVGKEAARHAMTQDDINSLLIDRALEGKRVCRLKGGDPFVFGRGGEEALHCLAHGVPFEIVPGVTSSIAAPAYAGIPVTQREVATSFAVVTGHTKDDDAPPAKLPVADTLVFLMGVKALPKIVAQLVARGDSPETPVALVRWGTTVDQHVVTGTLATIEADVRRAGLLPPALIVVGQVVRLREQLQWFDNRPLWGQTVIVTRAREQASSLVSGVRALGARVIQCPSIRVEPLDDYGELDAAIAGLDRFAWIVFSSVNGVEHFWHRLKSAGRDARWLAAARIAAIGPATATALGERGLIPDLVPERSVSEDVAEELIRQGVNGQRVLLLHALEGREVLNDALTAAGAAVMPVPCYRTVPDNSNAELARKLLQEGAVNWVTFTSSSTVRNFVETVGMDILREARAHYRIACIGPVTARTAEECGLTPDAVAAEASVDALVELLAGGR